MYVEFISFLSVVMPVRDIRVRAVGEVTINLTPEFRAIAGKKEEELPGGRQPLLQDAASQGGRGASGVEPTRCPQLRSRSRPDRFVEVSFDTQLLHN